MMGYRYQNKLDEENERRYCSGKPRWYRLLARVVGFLLMALFVVLALYGIIGWLVLKFV
jgi:cytochrome b561